MSKAEWLAARFEENRPHLSAVAYRLLGSISEADDAVQEAWLRLVKDDRSGVENLRGWLTTVVARIALDMLRARKARREDPLNEAASDRRAHNPQFSGQNTDGDPERELMLADSVGLALLVVLETLSPAERLAFVLHDVFAVPFAEIAPLVERTPDAARQMASRARRRIKGTPKASDADLARQKRVVSAFLAASRNGDMNGLLAVLDPDVVLRTRSPDGEKEVRGAPGVAGQALAFSSRASVSRAALVDGSVGIVVAPQGRLMVAFGLIIPGETITEITVITERAQLNRLSLSVLPD